MAKCERCGTEYDEKSFLIKLKSNGQIYRSPWICRDCAKKDEQAGFIVIIDVEGKALI